MTGKCMKCGNDVEGSLPICPTCRIELKDFQKLADFLNKFDGKMEDALWLIGSEISNRQSFVMSSCKIVKDERGTHLEAPSGKPYTRQMIDEIEKLYRAKNILKEHYRI